MADPITAGLFIIGTGMQMYGQYKAGEAEAEAAEFDARMKNLQAEETLRRSVFQERSMEIERDVLIGKQIAGLGKRGIDVSNASLDLIERTSMMMNREIFEMKQDAQWRADMLRRGAEVSEKWADDRRVGSAFGMATTLLTSGYEYTSKIGKTTSGATGIGRPGR